MIDASFTSDTPEPVARYRCHAARAPRHEERVLICVEEAFAFRDAHAADNLSVFSGSAILLCC